MKNKKAIDMSIGIIIALVIVLVVGALLVFLITDKSSTFSEGANSCEYGGGECMPLSQCTGPRIDFVCPEDQSCCIT